MVINYIHKCKDSVLIFGIISRFPLAQERALPDWWIWSLGRK